MPAQLTTRAQVNGYRFLLKRYEHALIRRDVRMLHDPMRSHVRALTVGAVLGVLAIAGALIMSFLRPQGAIGDAKIVMGKQTGALYVVQNSTLYPVLNLASARLISGSSEAPTSVKESKLTMARGPLLGIAGAPAALPGPGGGRSTWTLCDAVAPSGSTAASTIAVGDLDTSTASRAHPIGGNQALLATSREGKTYLVFDGHRAEVDINDSVVVSALGLRGVRPRPIGRSLLDATIALLPLAVPHIDGVGGPGPGMLAGVPVGGVIRVHQVAGDELYVVLSDGVQRVSRLAAEVVRTANSQGMSDIQTVTPDRLVGVPVVDRLALNQFPAEVPAVLSADTDPVTCLSWSRGGDDAMASLHLLAGRELPLPAGAKPVPMMSADATGDHVDAVYVRPGTGEYVQAVGITPGSATAGSLFYIADNGIRFGISDAQAAKVLGLPNHPKPAPEPILREIVSGPTLSKANAMVAHDTLPQRP